MNWSTLVCMFTLWRVPDYLAIAILALVAAVVGAKVRPHCRAVDWADPSIGHPFSPSETFPIYSVAIAVVAVAVLYIVGELCTRWRRPEGKLHLALHINGWILAHAWSILLAFAFVNISKLYAGRLRPDFLARLKILGFTESSWDTLTHDAQCLVARDGRLSFPSGHSGTSFAGFVPPCMYLMGVFRTLRGGKLWFSTVSLLPLILPVTIAISRSRDHRHNFDDILAGALCGAMCGVASVVLSFQPSWRGEWTLRDHPDEKVDAQASLSGHTGDDLGELGVMGPKVASPQLDLSMPAKSPLSPRHRGGPPSPRRAPQDAAPPPAELHASFAG